MAGRVANLIKTMGFADVVIKKDLSGKDRMVRGIYSPSM
jgi:hypothetical protein